MEIRSSAGLPRVRLGQKEDNKENEKKPAEATGSFELGTLQSAVENNAAAKKDIDELSEQRSVEAANRESAAASVRDVEAASALGDAIASRIVKNGEEALNAQANQSPASVKNLLA